MMEQSVFFHNHEGEKLAGTLHLPDKPSARGLVLGHCFTCSRHTRILIRICQELAKTGCMALRFDFSGNGQSEGIFTETTYSKHIGEMKTAVSFLREKGASQIGLAGHSMGAAIAVLTAAEMDDIRAVCGMAGRLTGFAPARLLTSSQQDELERTGQVSLMSRGRSLQLSEGFFTDAGQHDLPERIRSLTSPLLVVHGDQDEIIPVAVAHEACDLRSEGIELSLIPGADHMFSREAHREAVARRVTDWFARHLGANPQSADFRKSDFGKSERTEEREWKSRKP